MDEDFILAQQLQEEWNLQVTKRHHPQKPLSVVDASWELVDPTPDLWALFMQFNDQFFWGQLEAVEVKWSMRMTQCAGICNYEGRGGMCSIRLSEPLLKLRPRKDLVETLLHEMIHAYLYVTNNKDRGEHGPQFCKHMSRINLLTGANITIYHDFHEEIDEYRRHWWRCDGPCQHRKPYYGYVKRATNRAPSAHDHWWGEHHKTCGGTFIKIREPENLKGKGKTKLSSSNCRD
ncbi:DNA-dependent metalloprotease SPRTN-like [Suncus etruscus]|uniref:DNA-dependent metalloprotease SPRTN-like n=1 Tax=Suncus etruscus TaxID=109475 RepID=UPI0021103898|nr:DNA-dependent metalloprotease SPRTN-like [Suncus etruscus]